MVYDFKENEFKKKQLLKMNIKDTSGKCAMILLILSLSTLLSGTIIVYILKIRASMLGIDNSSEMILGVSNEAYNFLVGYLPCIIADIIAISTCIFVFKKRIKEYVSLRKEMSLNLIVWGSFASIGVGIVSSIIFIVYSYFINSRGIEIPSPDFSIPKNTIYLILFFSYTCVIAPVFEEIIFRGYILNNMRRYGNIVAVIVSSIFFCLFHSNLVQFINPILMGIMLSFVAIKSESILPSIVIHMFNNTCAMLSTVITSGGSELVSALWAGCYYLTGIWALVYFILRYGKDFIKTINDKYKYLKIRKKIFYCFINKWSIIYILFYIVMVSAAIIEKNI